MIKFKNTAKEIVSFVFDKIINLFLSLYAHFVVQNKKQIADSVLILALGGIGDFIMLTASLQSYRKVFQKDTIVIVGREELLPLIDKNPFSFHFIGINYKKFRFGIIERFKLFTKLKEYNVKICINTSYSSSHEFIEHRIIKWTKSDKNICLQCLDKIDKRDYSIYTDIIQQKTDKMFEIQRNNEVLCYLGGKDHYDEKTYIWGLSDQIVQKIKTKYQIDHNCYAIFAGSGVKKKCWNISNFITIIKALSNYGLKPILLGSKLEQEDNQKIVRSLPKINVLDLTLETDLIETSAIIKNSKFIISNDSSAAHIAKSVGTKAFVILGGGHYGRFLPYQDNLVEVFTNLEFEKCFYCQWECVYDSFKCLQTVTPEEILKRIRSLYF